MGGNTFTTANGSDTFGSPCSLPDAIVTGYTTATSNVTTTWLSFVSATEMKMGPLPFTGHYRKINSYSGP